MTQLLLSATFVFFFWIGYKFGRRVERWEQNHPKKNSTE
jgi:hypothetical protein